MEFSRRFLSALGGWQRGWREDKERRLALADELVNAVHAENLAPQFRTVDTICYRKRFLVPSNPQNGGDFGPLFINGFVEEGLASWTIDERFAQDFKYPVRDGTIAAIFAHLPQSGEVLVNIPALWTDEAFVEAVKAFHADGGPNSDALMYFKFRQSEIVMDAALQFDEVAGLCGRSSPFDLLCDAAGLETDEERDDFWDQLVRDGKFPEEPTWLSSESTKAALDRARTKFFEKHGSTIAAVIESRANLCT